MTQTLLSVAVGDLYPDPSQPRKHFIGEEIQRLADSITARGVLTPLRVMKAADGLGFVIITGESRWRACKLAGRDEVPCIVVERADEADLLADRVIENHCRSDISAIELARAIVKLKRLRGCTARTLSKELGICGSALSKTESLLSLPDAIQSLVEDGSVPVSIAYELSRLNGPENEAQQLELAHAVAAGRMNRRAVTEAVAEKMGGRAGKPKDSHLSLSIEGVSVSVNSDSPLTPDTLLTVFRRLVTEAKEAKASGKAGDSLADLLSHLKAS